MLARAIRYISTKEQGASRASASILRPVAARCVPSPLLRKQLFGTAPTKGFIPAHSIAVWNSCACMLVFVRAPVFFCIYFYYLHVSLTLEEASDEEVPIGRKLGSSSPWASPSWDAWGADKLPEASQIAKMATDLEGRPMDEYPPFINFPCSLAFFPFSFQLLPVDLLPLLPCF